MRSVEEWIGKTDDTPIPDRVRTRVFLKDGGICQCGCGIKISNKPWETDHTIAIINGGKNRESNLRTLLSAHHKPKTAEDVAQKAYDYRVRKRHIGIKKLKRTIPGRRFDGTPIPSRMKWI